MTLTIAGVGIGGDNPCRFIFEVSNAHNGSLDRAHRLVDAAKSCGADFVKFQAYRPSELIELRGDGPAPAQWGEQGWTMHALYEKAQTRLEWLPELFQHARDIGIVPFSSAFGLESIAMLERCATPAYKIASLDSAQQSLVEAVASRGKPVLVSRSPARAFSAASPPYQHRQRFAFLHCPAGYPAKETDVSLPWFTDCGAESSVPTIGLSSHCLDPLLPIAAVSRGCAVIEMHGMLDDEPSELEANVSLRASDFAQMIRDVRRVEAMLA